MPRNALYAQSGGVTAVINVSAQGVIETARRHARQIGTVYAGRNGIIGALTEDLIDTSQESDAAIAALRYTPSGAFGSCRHKLKGFDTNLAEYERLIEVFKAHDIGYFFYNGGGDSADTCLKVSQLGDKLGYPIQAIHVPKTMDNDLPLTDTCPGFGSVAKYTAVFILEVMGRHAGWTAAAGGLAAERPGDAPQVILFPEIVFDEEKFLAGVAASVKAHGFCAIVASEGLRVSSGQFLSETGTKDAFGHAQLGGLAPQLAKLVSDKLKYKYHYAIADYLMRAARHIASKTDVEQSYAVGRAAVELALAGKSGLMVTIERKSDSPYVWTTGSAPLDKVANVERKMPRDYITPDGFHITDKCRRYLSPLIQGEDYPPYVDGLPQYVTLKNAAVPKKLKTAFALKQ